MPLLDATEAKQRIPNLTGTGDDAQLLVWIARAEEALAEFCNFPEAVVGDGRSLSSTSYTFFLDGPDIQYPSEIVLPVRPLISIASIHVDANWGYGASTEITAADYTLDLGGGRVLLNPTSGKAWATARRAIRVVCVAGLGTATVSEQIKDAICRTVQENWSDIRTANTTSATQSGATKAIIVNGLTIPASAQFLVSKLVLHEHGFGGGSGWAIG